MLLLALAEGVKGAAAAAGDEDSNSKTGLCRLRMLHATATVTIPLTKVVIATIARLKVILMTKASNASGNACTSTNTDSANGKSQTP